MLRRELREVARELRRRRREEEAEKKREAWKRDAEEARARVCLWGSRAQEPETTVEKKCRCEGTRAGVRRVAPLQ